MAPIPADNKPPFDPFVLTPRELADPLWLRLKEWLAAELNRAREQNDGPLSAEDTWRLRGKIQALKGFRGLGGK